MKKMEHWNQWDYLMEIDCFDLLHAVLYVTVCVQLIIGSNITGEREGELITKVEKAKII